MIGIISINRYSVHMNYGAALHSFAFQKFLDKQKLDNIIINYYPNFMNGYHLKYPILNARTLKEAIKWIIGGKANKSKYNKFESFFNNTCRFTKQTYTEGTLDKLMKGEYNIDTLICESDVIWKPSTTKGVDNGYFLHFKGSEKCKKISYAASVGLKASKTEINKMGVLLKDFYAISVRELDSVNFINEISGKETAWVIDPTLLLTEQDYSPYIKKPKEENYLLVYNCMNNDKDMLRIAQKTANRMNLKLIEISAFPENNILFKHTVKTNLGIEEFLGYFANASYIICNAFHGSCFAILFKKNFHLFQREEYDYRLKSIITPLEIEETYITNAQKKADYLTPISLDFQSIENKLNQFRKESEKYILNAILK